MPTASPEPHTRRDRFSDVQSRLGLVVRHRAPQPLTSKPTAEQAHGAARAKLPASRSRTCPRNRPHTKSQHRSGAVRHASGLRAMSRPNLIWCHSKSCARRLMRFSFQPHQHWRSSASSVPAASRQNRNAAREARRRINPHHRSLKTILPESQSPVALGSLSSGRLQGGGLQASCQFRPFPRPLSACFLVVFPLFYSHLI